MFAICLSEVRTDKSTKLWVKISKPSFVVSHEPCCSSIMWCWNHVI